MPGSVLVNNALFLALFPEPRFAGTLCAVVLGAGWFFLTVPWFATFIVAAFAVLALTVARGNAETDWFGPLMLLVATGGLALVLHVGRVRSIRRLELLKRERDLAEDTSQRLATAVHQSLDGIAVFDVVLQRVVGGDARIRQHGIPRPARGHLVDVSRRVQRRARCGAGHRNGG